MMRGGWCLRETRRNGLAYSPAEELGSLRLPVPWLLPDAASPLRRPEVWEVMRPAAMQPVWGPDHLERFVRSLRLPRTKLEHLSRRLREAGWTDAEVEPLDLANTELRQTGELLMLTARNLGRRPLVDER